MLGYWTDRDITSIDTVSLQSWMSGMALLSDAGNIFVECQRIQRSEIAIKCHACLYHMRCMHPL